MLSLSSCWNSHRHQEGDAIVDDALRLGFEYIELSHGLKVTHLPDIIKRVNQGEIKISSIHNFCPSPVEVMMDAPDVYEYTSLQSAERERALDLTKRTLETAARLGADRVVIHLGCVRMRPYTNRLEDLVDQGKIYSREYNHLKLEFVANRAKLAQRYLDRARSALDLLLPHCEEHRIKLGIETRSHFEQIPSEAEMFQLIEHYQDNPWIGFWHDFGHVQRKANLGLLNHAEFLAKISPHLIGCHIHDVAWSHQDHRVPFTGGDVDFDTLVPLLPKNIPWVWELSPTQRQSVIAAQLPLWKSRFGN
jgi:sugar phosphate isomerase/epimerase